MSAAQAYFECACVGSNHIDQAHKLTTPTPQSRGQTVIYKKGDLQ